MADPDAIFDGIAALGRQIAEQRSALRQATKDARNAQRRRRYAATKHLPKPVKAAPVLPGDEWGSEDDWEDGCTCYRSAPCHYCITRDES